MCGHCGLSLPFQPIPSACLDLCRHRLQDAGPALLWLLISNLDDAHSLARRCACNLLLFRCMDT